MNNALIEKADALIIELAKYDDVTARLFSIQLTGEITDETIGEIEAMLTEREGVRLGVEKAHKAFVELIGGHPIDDGGELGSKVREMLNLQLEIMKKDRDFSKRFAQKYDEVKTKLRDAQGDKRKIDYLHMTAGSNNKGGSFNA